MKKYKYSDVKLTPTIIEELIILLFEGQVVERKTIIDGVVKYHIDNGGIESDSNIISATKRALQTLKRKELIDNIAHKQWKIFTNSEKTNVITKNVSKQIKPSNPIKKYAATKPTLSTNSLEFGQGKNAVYVFHYEIYKEKYHSKGNKFYPCKIGLSINPNDRVTKQVGTAFPEPPIVDLIIKTDNAALLEKVIHNVLSLRDRHCENSLGKEWFYTNPIEILSIISFINIEIL